MSYKINDRVKQLNTSANRLGTIIGIYEEDVYVNSNGERILFAVAGELKVKFDYEEGDGFTPMSRSEVELLD
ncbi:MAG: hypothetical protein ABJF04_25745 [Reichenbachiella sp.]|uniref:hypothetical protein n=1 Tax=Reichenbachiella sp. TaxID=2184521 RepID=UPI003266AF31